MKIDYTNIDEKCIDMVKFFNLHGLTTQFSCEGHDDGQRNAFEIMFDNSVSNLLILLDLLSHQQ